MFGSDVFQEVLFWNSIYIVTVGIDFKDNVFEGINHTTNGLEVQVRRNYGGNVLRTSVD